MARKGIMRRRSVRLMHCRTGDGYKFAVEQYPDRAGPQYMSYTDRKGFVDPTSFVWHASYHDAIDDVQKRWSDHTKEQGRHGIG